MGLKLVDLVLKDMSVWGKDDQFLTPQIQDDPLLYAFEEDSETDEPTDPSELLIKKLKIQVAEAEEKAKKAQMALES